MFYYRYAYESGTGQGSWDGVYLVMDSKMNVNGMEEIPERV
jgi:hypothetical protein